MCVCVGGGGGRGEYSTCTCTYVCVIENTEGVFSLVMECQQSCFNLLVNQSITSCFVFHDNIPTLLQ